MEERINMFAKLLLIIIYVLFMCSCNHTTEKQFGLIFNTKELPDINNTGSLELLDESEAVDETQKVCMYFDGGKQNACFLKHGTPYQSIIPSLPSMLTVLNNNENIIYPFKVSDNVYEFEKFKIYDNDNATEFIDYFDNNDFYGWYIGVNQYAWNLIKPDYGSEDYKPYERYNTDYKKLLYHIINEDNNVKENTNLYIITAGFTNEYSGDYSFSDFCSDIATHILSKSDDNVVGIIGFLTETNSEDNKKLPYYIVAIGKNEDVYVAIDEIESKITQRTDIGENDFFKIYFNQLQLNCTEYNRFDDKYLYFDDFLSFDNGLTKYKTDESYISLEIDENHFIWDIVSYKLKEPVKTSLNFQLPYEITTKYSSANMFWEVEYSLEIVEGELQCSQDMSQYGRQSISVNEFEFVYSDMNDYNNHQIDSALSSKMETYNSQLNQKVEDYIANQIVSIHPQESYEKSSINIPIQIDTSHLKGNIPYVVTLHFTINSVTSYDVFDKYGFNSVSTGQSYSNIKTILSWNNTYNPLLLNGIESISSVKQTDEYMFTLEKSFIIYKNE